MQYIVIFLAGIFCGAIIMSLTIISNKNNLEEEKYNAEKRAMDYARTIKIIEDIILKSWYGSIVDRIDKIKEVILNNKSINNF